MDRILAAGILLALAMTTGGCVQAVTGGPIAFEATPATVDGGTLDSTGYELSNRDSVTVERTVQVPVVGERQVDITNHVRAYSRADVAGENADENAAGAFLVVSTPQAKVAGQGTNPLGRVPLKELITRVGSRSGSQRDIEKVGQQQVEVLGTTTTAEKYSSTTEVEGQSVETFVYVVRVGHGDDYIIGVGILPKEFADDESTIYELMRGINHGGGN